MCACVCVCVCVCMQCGCMPVLVGEKTLPEHLDHSIDQLIYYLSITHIICLAMCLFIMASNIVWLSWKRLFFLVLLKHPKHKKLA